MKSEEDAEESAVADPLASEMMEDVEDQRPEGGEADKASLGLSDSSTGAQLENSKEV